MPSKLRPRISALALKTLYGTLASALLFSSAACAAGLGKLTVLSSLGQPLRAEIELTSVSSDEVVGLVVKVAPVDAFKLANIEYSPALRSLRFTVEQRNGRQFIKIISSQPVNEPFVDMLLELSWSSGRLVREYTFLLDPAELRTTQSAQVVGAADVPGQGMRDTAASQAAATAPAPVVQPARAPTGRSSRAIPAPSESNQYKVKRGDSLGRIAESLKPGDISLDMMLVALYRANPDAFIGNNMNLLKSGQILSVPDSDTIRGSGSSEGEAHGVVIAHAADFNAYRNKLAGQVANAAPAKGQDGTQRASGKIIAKVEERATTANESKDQLKLSKAAPGALGKSVAPGAEDAIANNQALADSTARVKELERNVSDLEKLMAVKNKPDSEAGKSALAEVNTVEAVPPVAPAVPMHVAKPDAVKPAAVTQVVALSQAPESLERSLADLLMDNISMIGAALVALLLTWFGLSRRKPKDAGMPLEPSILGAPSGPAHSLFDDPVGQNVDTTNSVFNSSFAPSASQLDANEVDPVAEADVYIAYGREAQAEEILKEALRTHPERFAARLKLLEIYVVRKDLRAFEAQAGELYGLSRGQGDDWAQAAALGLSIDPLNPMYAPAGASVVVAEESAAQSSRVPPHEQDLTAARENHQMAADVDLARDRAAVASGAPQQSISLPDDEHMINFDLGELDLDLIARAEPSLAADLNDSALTTAPIMAPAVSREAALPSEEKPPSEEALPFDLAFDLAFDSPVTASLSAAPTALDVMPLDLTSDKRSAAFDMAELAREFDLPYLAESTLAGMVVADPLAELDMMLVDLPSTPSVIGPESQFALDDDPFALPDLPGVTPARVTTPHFDIADLDLDLPIDASAAGGAELLTTALVPVGQAELSASQMEMETKLDLAIAYQEIGDKEGARELLDEVINGGNDEQISKANDLRARLA